MKFYFAGKVYRNCWRHELVSDLGDWSHRNLSEWPVLERSLPGNHDYTGPFFQSSGRHFCAHECGGCEHGNDGDIVFDNHAGATTPESVRPHIFTECRNAILRSDAVLAVIESTDCYGTLCEIGFAKGAGKTVWVAQRPWVSQKDIWFACYMSDRSWTLNPHGTSSILWLFNEMQKELNTQKGRLNNWREIEDEEEKRHAYYASMDWAKLRTAVKDRENDRCEHCRVRPIQVVHHKTYIRLYNESLDDLCGLCRQCHREHHNMA